MNLLDTDTLTLLMYGHDAISKRVAAADSAEISVISRIEVLQGRFASILKAPDSEQIMRAQERLQENERYMLGMVVIPFDLAAAAKLDVLRQNSKLKKIGRADLLIACIALAHRATLITRNLKHFRQVPGLLVENWAD